MRPGRGLQTLSTARSRAANLRSGDALAAPEPLELRFGPWLPDCARSSDRRSAG